MNNQNAWARFREILRTHPRPWLLRADTAISVAAIIGTFACIILAFFFNELGKHARFWMYSALSLVFILPAYMCFVHFKAAVQEHVYYRDNIFFAAFITAVLWFIVIVVALTGFL